MTHPAFHLAFPVDDLPATEDFYAGLLGCEIGRRNGQWIDFDFFGHQITAHLKSGKAGDVAANQVDGDAVPIPHFGVVMAWEDWGALVKKLQAEAVDFVIEPRIRFEGEPGEQGTFFLRDPSGNALEFKTFRDMGQLFATEKPA